MSESDSDIHFVDEGEAWTIMSGRAHEGFWWTLTWRHLLLAAGSGYLLPEAAERAATEALHAWKTRATKARTQ
ncbi:hypothetical protein CBX98_25665 [Vibrio sp. T9]|nr:hypothetical protein CBX98_25665 [Vibrio sp. T9]